MVEIFIFLFGLAVGSFLNCVIYRLERNESFFKGRPRKTPSFFRKGRGLGGRSFCPNCRHILNWQDLIPVFSFLILKGKCRYCQKPISIQYPLIELATGIIFLLIFLPHTNINIWTDVYLLIISSFLIVIFVYDLKHYIIPDKVIYPAITTAFLYCLFRTLEFRIWNLFRPALLQKGGVEFRIFETLLNPFLSAFLASTFFLIIVLISRGKWMGIGDIKLAFLMGLILGWPNILVALFSAFLIGAIIGIGLIIFGKKNLKSEVPFGPFLVTGTFIAFFWGETALRWYLQFVMI